MRNIINMQFPYKENDDVLDGNQHQIEPLSLTEIPNYNIDARDSHYYVLYYRDLRLVNEETYCTILLRQNNSIFKVPLLDYENLQFILDYCENKREEDIDEFFENITNINSVGFASVKDIIEKLKLKNNKTININEQPLTASIGKPINPPNINLYNEENPTIRREPIKAEKENSGYNTSKNKITIYITSNKNQYIKMNDPYYFDAIKNIQSDKEIIHYLPGIGIDSFVKLGNNLSLNLFLPNFEIEYINVSNIVTIDFDNKQYISKDEYQLIFGLYSSNEQIPVEVKTYGDYVVLSNNEYEYINRHFGVSNKNIKDELKKPNENNEIAEDSRIVLYSDLNSKYVTLNTYSQNFSEQPQIVLHYLPGIGSGEFIKISSEQEQLIRREHNDLIENNDIKRIKLYSEEKIVDDEVVFDEIAYLTPKEYFLIFKKELLAENYITLNKSEYGGLPDDGSLYRLTEEEVRFIVNNYTALFNTFHKREKIDEYTK